MTYDARKQLGSGYGMIFALNRVPLYLGAVVAILVATVLLAVLL